MKELESCGSTATQIEAILREYVAARALPPGAMDQRNGRSPQRSGPQPRLVERHGLLPTWARESCPRGPGRPYKPVGRHMSRILATIGRAWSMPDWETGDFGRVGPEKAHGSSVPQRSAVEHAEVGSSCTT